ncbi:unnamed protein product [Ilex paraguariensis]|uniref:PAP/OAS1 substrate-binding-related domain-containing protein n=1 Tax=Ilex paraguariensis TaxID=185542 RepID=A0ABC8SA72_9AQUA
MCTLMGDLREPTGDWPVPAPSTSTSTNPSPWSIRPERWATAEKATQNIICKVQPTAVSEERRREVIAYVQRLIRGRLGCEVKLNLMVGDSLSCCGQDIACRRVMKMPRVECVQGKVGWMELNLLANAYDSGLDSAVLLDYMVESGAVFPYGSVPLKTYLPDGDIDLTAFGVASVEDAMAHDMVSILEGEDQSCAAEFVVKDVQLIRAESTVQPTAWSRVSVILCLTSGCMWWLDIIVAVVKLVKCIVQNIVVDISFNQIGGLCALCFLEQVDCLIRKDHLFKRSVILIKAWCYYESRILGAHHGLISTYALETLVLYIFHLFHSTLNGPLAVLYRFLDYFSKFDWDNYCISLIGPVRLSSLPEIVAEAPENGGSDLLLSNDFLRFCVETFSVPLKGVDINSRTFLPKHLNIVDPLKQSNNLGRSVSKGNFFRIRSAFTYGARKLGQILLQPEENIDVELLKFFSNTLDRHGSGPRPDVQDSVPIFNHSRFEPAFSVSETKPCQEYKVISKCIDRSGDFKFNPDGLTQDTVNNIEASGTETTFSKMADGHQRGYVEVCHSTKPSEADSSSKRSVLLGFRWDSKDLSTTKIHGLRISNDSAEVSPLNVEVSASSVGIAHHAPHLYFSNSRLGNGDIRHGISDSQQSEHYENEVSSGLLQAPDGGGIIIGHVQHKNLLVGDQEVPTPVGSKDDPSVPKPVAFPQDLHHVNWDCASESNAGNSESLKLSDLSGDYDSQLNYLRYGRLYYEYALSVPALPMPPPPPPPLAQFQFKNSWDAIQHSSQFNGNGVSHGSANGVLPSPAFYPMNPVLVPGGTFGLEEMPKPRGTGTYFPNMSRSPQGYRPSTVKGRNQAPVKSPRKNGWGVTPIEANMLDGSSREQSQSAVAVDHVGGKPGSSDIHQCGSPRGKVHPHANGSVLQSGGVVDFGSVGHALLGAPLLENSRQPRTVSLLPQASSQGLPSPGTQKPKILLPLDQDRVTVQSSYHLKDDDDFPPLSV